MNKSIVDSFIEFVREVIPNKNPGTEVQITIALPEELFNKVGERFTEELEYLMPIPHNENLDIARYNSVLVPGVGYLKFIKE